MRHFDFAPKARPPASLTTNDAADLDRRLTHLAAERGALFDEANATFGLSVAHRQRLHSIEHEIDECFLARRVLRAARDRRRFDREDPTVGRVITPRHREVPQTTRACDPHIT
jgi:hypothetical protein